MRPTAVLASGQRVNADLVIDLDEMADDYATAHGCTMRVAREAMVAVLRDRLDR